MRIGHGIVSIAAGIGIAAGLVGTAQAEPLRIRYSIWVGYGPLFVAAEKGFFAKEGVEVELIRIEDDTATLAALFAGQIDALATATQVTVASNEPDEEALACVLMLDDSRGGDGILATNDIQTIADLKGRSVAFGTGASRSSTSTSCSGKLASVRPTSKSSTCAAKRRPKPS
jgi:NitT/TauT family transport system substrate-binding protein